jgi:hypothetical protein
MRKGKSMTTTLPENACLSALRAVLPVIEKRDAEVLDAAMHDLDDGDSLELIHAVLDDRILAANQTPLSRHARQKILDVFSEDRESVLPTLRTA